ncbi:MAG: methyltransferase [Pseudomonadota bacterium]
MTEICANHTLRKDAFLGGKLQLWQPKKGYRAGIDPVLLAASVPAVHGQSVLDLGCGAGAVILSLATRVAGLKTSGLEKHAGFAALAQKNAIENAIELDVHCAAIEGLPNSLKNQSFDHVVANPPYYDRTSGSRSTNPDRESALGEVTPIDVWVSIAAKRLKPKGYAHFILKADRLVDALSSFDKRLGSIEVLPIAARSARAAELVIIRARKEGRARFKLHAPFVLHQGYSHPGDQDHYSQPAREILRHGAALDF